MKAVIFDTNAYRVLTYGVDLEHSRAKALQIRNAEAQSTVTAFAHPIVVWELLTHLMDPADKAYNLCLNAMVALGEHTASRSDTTGAVCLVADAFSAVCRELFGRLPPGYEEGLKNLGALVLYIVKNAPDLSNSKAQENIKMLGSGMAAKEKAWLDGMTGILDNFAPGTARAVFGDGSDSKVLRKVRGYFDSPEFFEAWSRYVVASNAVEIGIRALHPDELRAKGAIVRQNFPVSFHLMRALLKKLATPRPPDLANPKHKRWNFVWDSLISFTIGPGTIMGAPVFLVSGDAEIVEAANEAGFDTLVLSLDDYLRSIGIS